MTDDPLRKRRIAAFLQLAIEEREAAERLASPLPRQTLYFAQQAVEKIIQAVLEIENIPAGASHNIRYLAELLPDESAFKKQFIEFDPLTPASTRYRYRSAGGRLSSPSSSEVEAWLQKIRVVEVEVRKFSEQREGL